MEERRLLLAVALSLLVLTGYQLLFPPPPPAPSPDTTPPLPSPAPGAPAEAATPVPEPTPVAEPVAAAVAAEAERRVEVHTRDLEVAFTNRGAELVSWRLRDYQDDRERPEEMVQTFQGLRLPLSVETGDAELDRRLSEALFVPSRERIEVAENGEATLRFQWAEGDVSAEKTLRFAGRGFLVSVAAAVERAGSRLPVRLLWGPGVANPSAAERGMQGYQEPRAVVMTRAGDVERTAADDIEEREFAEVRWGGVESKYFAALWVPADGAGRVVAWSVEVPAVGELEARDEPVAALSFPPGAREALLYVGPKDYFVLRDLGHGLSRVVDVGDWIGPIVVPLMRLLRWVNGYVGNYGWSIVVLTVLINLVMAPLRHISIANGVKMAKLAPEMRVIQERYRKVPALDPRRQEMQKEIAALYARHGMSMSTQMTVGCLPLLLTMPFLIAFYNLLQIYIGLRGADFLWIPDLSRTDPLYLTPVLMGVSMFAMQRMTPSTLDPTQQRMMMIMPLMLLGLFLFAPAGLNLYWLSSNLCSIVQQGVTLRLVRGREKAGPPVKLKAGKKSRRERRKR